MQNEEEKLLQRLLDKLMEVEEKQRSLALKATSLESSTYYSGITKGIMLSRLVVREVTEERGKND